MSQHARNDNEVRAMFAEPLKKVVDYIVQKIWNENRAEIRIVVYETYQPSSYNRTGDFQKAWDYSSKTNSIGDVVATGEFFYNPETMSLGSNDYQSDNYGQHVSVVDGKDMRPYLAEIIYQGLYGSAWKSNVQARDAWDRLLKVIGKRKMRQWLGEGMKKEGLKGTLHNVPIKVEYN